MNLIDNINSKLEDQKPLTLITGTSFTMFIGYGIYKIYQRGVQSFIYDTFKSIPLTKGLVQKEIDKTVKSVLSLIPKIDDPNTFKIPEKGCPKEIVLERMKKMIKEEESHRKDVVFSGTIYMSTNSQHSELLCDVFKLYVHSNILHTFTWPSLRKMEAEVISMAKNLLNGDDEVCGSMTTGGTESIIVAMKTYRDFAKTKGIYQPEMICPITGHAAYWKACEYLGIKMVEVPVNKTTYEMEPSEVEKYITSRTIVIISSAPNFPQGIIDPIEELGKIALKHNVGLHVDCCLGGFFLPFTKMNQLGDIRPFDFSVKGVTSISTDTHKYGFASKGTSVILYKNKELKKHQFSLLTNWSGGIYASPTITGSKPGALIATCWASLISMGLEGFLEVNKNIMKEQKIIKEGIKNISEIELMGDPQGMILAWKWKNLKSENCVFAFIDIMKKKWELNALLHPFAVHVCLTQNHIGKGEDFVNDLKEATKEISMNFKKYEKGTAGIYGTSVEVKEATDTVIETFLHGISEVEIKLPQ